jgi:hypothetical protein
MNGARYFVALVTGARVILVGDDVINCPHVAATTNPLTAKARVIVAMTDYSFFGA